MISAAFLAQNIHFALSLLGTLVCFIVGWLYLDAGDKHHPVIKICRWLGFFMIAAGLLVGGVTPQVDSVIAIAATILRGIGYTLIVVGSLLEPLQPRPHTTGLSEVYPTATTLNAVPPISPSVPVAPPVPQKPFPAIAWGSSAITTVYWLLPAAAGMASFLYWRRATTGLERHLKGIALGLSLLTVYELISLTNLWQTSDNPLLNQLVRPLSLLWICAHLVLLAAGITLARWSWRYLTKRIQTQLFMVATIAMVSIVLTTTVTITGLMLSSIQANSLTNLQSSAKVLSYAIDNKTADTRAAATILAGSASISVAATSASRANLLAAIAAGANTRTNDITITDASGQVLVRSDDPDHYGDSLSADARLQHALAGTAISAVASRNGAILPGLEASTAAPIIAGGKVIGAVIASQPLDNTFVDSLKHTTGLDSTLYTGQIRTATTQTAPNGTSRLTGTKESHPQIIKTTLKDGKVWSGALVVSNLDYLITYTPLKDANQLTIGMLAVGQPESIILAASNRAISLTYLSAIVWLVVMVGPIYLVSRQIAKQLS